MLLLSRTSLVTHGGMLPSTLIRYRSSIIFDDGLIIPEESFDTYHADPANQKFRKVKSSLP